MFTYLRRLLCLPSLNLSAQSWWIIVGLFSWGIPLCNYIWFGPRYYEDGRVLVIATLLGFAICLPYLILQTALVRHIVNRFPSVEQTFTRVCLELLLTACIALVVEQTVRYCYMLAFSNFDPSRQTMLTILIMGFITNVVSVGLYECYYTLTKWKEKSLQAEAYKREALLNQLEVLQNQVNPHFLFNSLNSLVSLIGQDPKQAEAFTLELSLVYRYVLQANEGTLTDLATELKFIQSYYHLLKTRYGQALDMAITVDEQLGTYRLPPLTLQLLVENAVKHNIVSVSKPLHIQIRTARVNTNGKAQLQVCNTLQRKSTGVLSNGVGLNNILVKYEMLGQPAPIVQEESDQFVVTLPLIETVAQPL